MACNRTENMNPKLIANLFFCCMELCAFAASASYLQQRHDEDTRHFKFHRETSGKAMKKGGIEISFTNFKAEDGTLVERIIEDYKSAEAARIGLENECWQSSSISEDGYRTDAQGERVGQRVVLVFSPTATAPERNVIAWTDGPLLYLLRSSSRAHLLDFEQQVYPAVQPRSVPKKPWKGGPEPIGETWGKKPGTKPGRNPRTCLTKSPDWMKASAPRRVARVA
jgi:hypothetical protein